MILEDRPEYLDEISRDDMDYPERLTLEMTSYCNLRCWMCPKTAGYVNTKPNQVIREDVIEKVRAMLPKIEVLQLSGLWGEVFLHPEIYLKILKEAKERFCEVRTISNGTLLTPEISEQLVDLGLDDLTISIDAATGETYKQIRVGGDFKKLIKQIKKLQKIKRKKGSVKPSIHFAFVGMKKNIHELPDLVRLAGKFGIVSVILQEMGEFENTRHESLIPHFKERAREIYEKAVQVGRERGVKVELFPPDQFDDETIRVEPPRGIRDDKIKLKVPEGYRKACDVPWKETVITTTGDVMTCCAAQRPIGNILESSFEEIWFSPEYGEFRKKVISREPPAMCVTCTGVGWRKDTVLKDYLKMGEADGQLGTGWYHLEANPVWERTYRWTKGRAAFFLLNSGRNRKLSLEMRIGGVPKEGDILVSGEYVGSFAMEKSVWERVEYDLPEGVSDEKILKVEIRVKNPSKEGEDRRRRLGVAVSEAFLK